MKNIIKSILTFIVVSMPINSVLAYNDRAESFANYHMIFGGIGGSMMGFGWFFFLLFWALVVIGSVNLVNYLKRPNDNPHKDEAALEILKERYVRGDIDKKEFTQKKKDLIK